VTPLITRKVFNSYDRERVESRKSGDQKCEMIVDLISRKSQAAFDCFIYTLQTEHHEHTVIVFLGHEIAAEIKGKVKANLTVQCAEMLEAQVREKMLQEFNNNDETRAKQLAELMRSNGFSVSQVTEGSIKVTFKCNDQAALESLLELYSSRKLDQLFTEAFCPQFADEGLESLSVIIQEEEFQQHAALKLMSPDHREALLSSAERLMDKIVISNDLLSRLSLCKRRERAVTEARKDDQVKTLLDIVSRQPDSAFTKFLEALDGTQQTDAASYLRTFNSAEANENALRNSDSASCTQSFDDPACCKEEKDLHTICRLRVNTLTGQVNQMNTKINDLENENQTLRKGMFATFGWPTLEVPASLQMRLSRIG